MEEKTSQEKTKKVVSTYVDIEIYERLKQESKDEFMSITDLVRKFIYKHYRELDLKNSAKLEERK